MHAITDKLHFEDDGRVSLDAQSLLETFESGRA
jgi:hypothetical protein